MSGHEDDVCSHVRVVVRVRPENQKEKEGNNRKVVHVVDKHLLVFDPKEEEVNFFHGKKTTNRDISKRKNKDLSFVFDAVFDENSTQSEVFENTTKIVLEGVLNGYNCTVLAYGATGSGKTHTMLGSPDTPGVMFLTMAELYKRIELIKDEKVCNVALSYLEVYNEQLRDLLGSSKPLALREDAQKGVVVQNLTLHQPKSADEVLEMLAYGNKNRTQHPTDMNATSSRSHAVFQIYLRQQDKAASINQNVRLAKMCLIDLAGSERASATNTKGARFREGANINRSLLALGNVINALADPKSKTQHIPYRNSKLTRLLKDSLGGNCRTIMIAAVSPSSFSYEDTYNTLKYANRAKDIKSAVKSNVVSLDSHISQYVKICEQQKKEIIMLKEKLCAYEEQKMDINVERRQSILHRSSQEKAEIQRLRELLKCVFVNREEIRKELLHLEMRQKENELKTSHQKQCHNQIHMICSKEKAVKATCKRDHRLAMLKTQHVHIQKKREHERKRFEENMDWLHRVENEMRLANRDGHMSEELSKDLQCCHLQLEVKDLHAQIQHMMHLVTLQEQENKHSEKLLNTVLPAFRRQYDTLREGGLSDATVEADFKEVEHLVRREKAVVWADETVVEDTAHNCKPQIPAVMAFSTLECSQTTPCSAEKRKNGVLERQKDPRNSKCALVRPFDGASFEELKENIPIGTTESIIPLQKPTRRKLMESPLARENHEPANPPCLQLDDSLSNEVLPIVYTPDTLKKTCLPDQLSPTFTKLVTPPSDFFQANDITCGGINIPVKVQSQTDFSLNLTFGCQRTDMNSTFILNNGTDDTHSESSGDLHPKQPQPCSSVLQRLALPPLINNHAKLSEKPSYMAMTSAAERKRKLLSSASCSLLKDDLLGPVTAKRVRQEVSQTTKAMRVRKAPGEIFKVKKEEQEAQRPLARSISEGNLIPAKTNKRTFTFLKSHTFMRVPKK